MLKPDEINSMEFLWLHLIKPAAQGKKEATFLAVKPFVSCLRSFESFDHLVKITNQLKGRLRDTVISGLIQLYQKNKSRKPQTVEVILATLWDELTGGYRGSSLPGQPQDRFADVYFNLITALEQWSDFNPNQITERLLQQSMRSDR